MQAMMENQQVSALGNDEDIWFLGHRITIKTTGEETGEALSVTEHYPPAGFGPPPHIHRNEDEAIYVLEGTISGFLGETTFRGGPGTYVLLNKGVPHTYKVEGDAPARLLIVTAPAGFERFIRDSGVPAGDPSAPVPPPAEADIEQMLVNAPQYGIEFIAPE